MVYSASDLAAAARCEYALLRAFDHKLGWGPKPTAGDDLLLRTAELGDAHEKRRLDELRRRFGDDVVHIGRPAWTAAALTAAAAATRRAIDAGAPVIYQAAMFDGRFVGFADFVISVGDRYQICDTKLARSAKVTALLQLAAYADVLAAAGVPVAPEAELLLGDRTVVRYPIAELLPVFRRQRTQLQRSLDEHLAGGRPVAWEDEHVRACFRCPECEIQVRSHDDLLLVAGMRVSQRARLLDAGVTTLAELADRTAEVPDLAERAAANLTAQAKLQVRQRATGIPQFEVADPLPLGQLPEPDDGDLFFDFEGDPLWTSDGADWGLEYLFGVVAANGRFHPLWAHDRPSERKALLDFLAMVTKRRRRHPKMHIYHYAAYEKTALLRLAGRYGVGEDEVDDLLRNDVLVDLYPLVRKSIRVGAESYGLKALEPLYLGHREGDVTTAADSITEYARYCRLRELGQTVEAAAVLDSIAEYNRADCESTRKLRDWLLMRAFECGVTHLTRPPIVEQDAQLEPDALGRGLAGFSGDAAVERRSSEQTAVALVAAARSYHKREAKPFWWAHFDRLNNPVDEWADTSGVFVVTDAEVITDWHVPPRARKPQRHVRLRGDLAGGVLDNQVFALYDPPAPTGMVNGDPDRRGCGDAEIISAVENDGVPTEVVIRERAGKNGEQFSQLPMALTPGQPVPTGKLNEAIETVAEDVLAGVRQAPPRLPRNAVLDILLRRDPRTLSGAPLPHGADDVDDITAALLDLDSSYVAVHGPPGTGKTFTAAAVIGSLVNEHRWRVGVVAQSHAVVENLLGCVIDAKIDAALVAKKRSPYGRGGAPWQQIGETEYPAFLSAAADGCVVGGTAWDFANGTRIPPGSLDLLVVDEAGQFCLANTIAVSQAAGNLLLLGDPQQLPQVSAGTHPEPVDASALGWLVDEHGTLPAGRGYFLARSYRMHPAVCRPVSALSYGGRLRSNDVAADRRLDGHRPGVRTVLVDHAGNATDSPQEAEAIVAEIRELLGAPWTDETGTRPLTTDDVLVVAPYNAQVLRLRGCLQVAGLDDVAVGTVDKFQGRQAPVVFVSMTASAVDDVPRGMSFLLNRNRLNVAISRAKYAAAIVRSPTLTEFLPTTPGGLIELGAFLSLSAPATP
ncbi:MAG: TM0106 family RecB-like putative nuclease [Mycobacteriaceae bacterium]|nr:TM0106 family RecB-like putative nuclease [Mycobacteriaceae bacterium]